MAAASAEWQVVPLAASINQRYTDTSVDGLLTNAYLQKDAVGAVWTRRRGALIEQAGVGLPDDATGPYGIMRALSGGGALYTGGNNAIYKNGTLHYSFGVAATGIAISFDQSTVTTVNELYAANGSEGAYDPGTGYTKIIDANYPAITVNGSAYLNGYLYVMDTKGSIWGTPNQNDFSVWSATNVVNAWGTSGNAVAIRSYLNEILAFKTYTVEVFYDAGNPVGSPLLPVQQVNIKWGVGDPRTIQKIDDRIFWVGQSQTGEVAVIGMNQFNPIPVSTEAINRLLSSGSATQNQITGSCSFEMGGDKFYAISLTSVITADLLSSTVTLAYNLSTLEWSLFDTTMITAKGNPGTTITGLSINSATFNQTLLTSNGQVLNVTDLKTADSNHLSGNPAQIQKAISLRLRTDNFSAGTMLRKMVSGLRLKSDRKAGSVLRIRWSDDDYQTWSSWRSIDMSKSVPMLPGLQGTFSKRAYELEYSGSDQIRISHLELLIALGDI